MKVSYKWLQSYFKDQLPPAEKLAELFTFHAFEVEAVGQAGLDLVLDIKVLPDRACYALSHRGIASEISAMTQTPVMESGSTVKIPPALAEHIEIKIKAKQCRRYIGRKIEGVAITASDKDVVTRLEVIGQRAISNIVDATNYVMFNIGQPLHAFDADKVRGALQIRKATDGERITLLDGTAVDLTAEMLVIADDEGPLAIAGVKGGARAAITDSTRNLILESANFDPSSIRKTSTALNLRSDSSKRFENNISADLARQGINDLTYMILRANPDAKVGPITDVYPQPEEKLIMKITADLISNSLGIDISVKTIKEILSRYGIETEDDNGNLKLTIPTNRKDLMIPEDIVEEIGRTYGYEKIEAKIPAKPAKPPIINKTAYWTEKIRDILTEQGFSEVFTYTLKDKGEIEIQNPLASDKNFLRTDLLTGLEEALTSNDRNKDLLGLSEIRIFEIGKIFPGIGEQLSLAFAIKRQKGNSTEAIGKMVTVLSQALGVDMNSYGKVVGNGFELNLDTFIETLTTPTAWDIRSVEKKSAAYKPVSSYPFIVRDLAVFVPEETPELEPEQVIKDHAGDLLVRLGLFDVFTKLFPDGNKKTSYAFRLVFQSQDRTLTDEEINTLMEKITAEMNGREGWQVR